MANSGQSHPTITELTSQLSEQRRKVDFDTYDLSVKEILSMVVDKLIDIAPEYQRQFRWDERRQSAFIESVFLGIPVPSLFMATNTDSTWELIDGVQRISSLIHYAGDEEARAVISRSTPLTLTGLGKLEKFNRLRFEDIPPTLQTQFLLKFIKVTTISDKSDMGVRFDLFERLNTGGVVLTNQEIRNCLFRGRFNDFLRQCADYKSFRRVVKLTKAQENDGTREEYVLRFFSLYHDAESFEHSVSGFLTTYMRIASSQFDYETNEVLFRQVFDELAKAFPTGIRRRYSTTPANLFEAIAVGAAHAIADRGQLRVDKVDEWIESDELIRLTTGGTNSRPMVTGRIEYCKKKFGGD